MVLVKTIEELQKHLKELCKKGSVGLVPTMGALHSGHLSLVERAVSENPTVVVSVFVNPTQFNDPDDLKRYPRTLEADLKLLEPTGCTLVFAPEPSEIYPEPDTRKFDFGHFEQVMEGKHRPGHFNGVAQVVSKLFEIVKPNKAYFGQKDFQQLAIINQMVKMLKMPVEVVACPIIREKSGLAMSSRNALLTPEERKNAVVIYETLNKARNLVGAKSVCDLEKWVVANINKNTFLDVEYFEVVDFESLQHVCKWDDEGRKIGCIAVFCGKVRLIDNIVLN
ncbi:pantoate--beta-alanine ligase [Mariniphaga anaerophila]|uniref:Pantothenate synthetase n=1 Tax=Mariniphaga anaerophila TaxID=1484053 RepID=A0A1M5CGD3_9BACT|nr:pantoate--beta-alanine ligase [Mariniphaga anaerophila]SHF53813.1 pantoate--beta-alanine ligase [Mariniphaga anaerophila]